ncbi:hypothetical protein QUF80_18295 [Desulfococcaceae bacterium HSG8]|nr:hypothetical protein [Desulfococcaceae bacterium HSG8]
MTKLDFRNCTLAYLDDTFALKQIFDSHELAEWLDRESHVPDSDRQILLRFQKKLIRNVHDWNEAELTQNFIGPVFALVDYTTEQFNFFAQRDFSGKVGDIEMTGRPDGMIASGFRVPKKPYFCFQEYKKEQDPEGDPAGQCLGAMLAAQEVNQHQHPVYGCYVIGADWYFMTLRGDTYAISPAYVATREDISDIFRILKSLKEIITNLADRVS